MKNLKKIIISIGFAVLAVMLFNDISIAGANISNPSIYGILTSDRWAYGTEYKREDLKPVPNNNPHPEPQPHRDHPQALAITKDGKKLYITLTGNEADPGNEVAVFDIAKRKLTKKIKVGSSPYYLGLHPNGKFLIVITMKKILQ